MNIVYVSPIYKPSVGGAAVYLDMMTQYFSQSQDVETFTVITEKNPKSSGNDDVIAKKTSVLRIFPFRAGRQKKNLLSYLLYVIQNAQYFYLLWYFMRHKVDAIFVHSSLHNNPNTLFVVIRIAKLFFKNTTYVLDVRDPKLPESRFYQCKIYDRIISCSNNVTQHLSKDVKIAKKVIEIPIPVEKSEDHEHRDADVLNRLGLNSKTFVFNGSGCSLEKGVKRLAQVVKILRQTDDVFLVVAGKKRYWDEELEKANNEGWLICTGELSHAEVMALSTRSLVDMNASSVDSMPRHTLEALIHGSTILLPNDIPEFIEKCPNVVVDYSSPESVAWKIKGLLSGKKIECSYDVSAHEPGCVFSQYISQINQNIK